MQHDRLLACSLDLMNKELEEGHRHILNNDSLVLAVEVLQYPSQETMYKLLAFLKEFLLRGQFREVFSLFTL